MGLPDRHRVDLQSIPDLHFSDRQVALLAAAISARPDSSQDADRWILARAKVFEAHLKGTSE